MTRKNRNGRRFTDWDVVYSPAGGTKLGTVAVDGVVYSPDQVIAYMDADGNPVEAKDAVYAKVWDLDSSQISMVRLNQESA